MAQKPKTKSEAQSPALVVRLPPDLWDGVRWLADREGEAISTIVRQLLRERLKAVDWPGSPSRD